MDFPFPASLRTNSCLRSPVSVALLSLYRTEDIASTQRNKWLMPNRTLRHKPLFFCLIGTLVMGWFQLFGLQTGRMPGEQHAMCQQKSARTSHDMTIKVMKY